MRFQLSKEIGAFTALRTPQDGSRGNNRAKQDNLLLLGGIAGHRRRKGLCPTPTPNFTCFPEAAISAHPTS